MKVNAMIEANEVVRTFGSGQAAVHALKGVSFAVPKGALVALKGRSGSGKTTLLNLIAMLDSPSSGTILLDGHSVFKLPDRERTQLRRKQVGLVFQSFALIPYMSAYENVEFGLRVAGVKASERNRLATEALDAVGMRKRMMHRPFELSGGEQQRVAIARGVAHQPMLLLADEPTAELDSRMSVHVMQAFRDMIRNTGMTIMMTTHDPAIMELVDHVLALEDGRIG